MEDSKNLNNNLYTINPKEVVRLKIPSDPLFIKKSRNVIDEICQRAGFDMKKTYQLKVAVSEALSNVIEHAYKKDKTKLIYIYFLITDERIEVIIRDFGQKPNFDTFKSRDLNDVKDRGLGLYLISKYTDVFEYYFSDEKENQVKFIKYK
ncbi:MAG TPA: ATP-binding protein [Spirochaetota bacterium]|nr:ATP-binding protein [Spirochaetota bacterium]HOM38446.1 ATP-binding protein [Spirochaetota bacterium]HPQ48986.1 ATP-binding protein [Spirochaetota bacterium]